MIGVLDVPGYMHLAELDRDAIDRFMEMDLGLDITQVFLITVDDDADFGRTIEVGQFRHNEDGRKFLGTDGGMAWAIEMFERRPDGQWAHTGSEVMN